MRARAVLALMGAVILATLYIVITLGELPERVATHFGSGGAANGWMERSAYLMFSLVLLNVLPLLILLFAGSLPRRFPGMLNIPARDYWLAPERREATLQFLWIRACLLGLLCVGMVCGMHYVLIEANRLQPPMLPMAGFIMVISAFLVGVGLWAIAFYRRFRANDLESSRS